MRESNRRAIFQALEDVSCSDDPKLQLDLAVEWIDWFRQHGSAGFIRETPPHVAKPAKPRPEAVLIKGEA